MYLGGGAIVNSSLKLVFSGSQHLHRTNNTENINVNSRYIWKSTVIGHCHIHNPCL